MRIHERLKAYRRAQPGRLYQARWASRSWASRMLGSAAVIVSIVLALAALGLWRVSALSYTLDVSFPGDVDLGVLAVGDNTSEMQMILVHSDVGYKIYVRADRDRLCQWDEQFNSYVAGRDMTEPLILFSDEGSIAVGVTDALLAHRPGPSPPAAVHFWFQQRVGFDDVPAPLGRVYRILLTYTVVQDV